MSLVTVAPDARLIGADAEGESGESCAAISSGCPFSSLNVTGGCVGMTQAAVPVLRNTSIVPEWDMPLKRLLPLSRLKTSWDGAQVSGWACAELGWGEFAWGGCGEHAVSISSGKPMTSALRMVAQPKDEGSRQLPARVVTPVAGRVFMRGLLREAINDASTRVAKLLSEWAFWSALLLALSGPLLCVDTGCSCPLGTMCWVTGNFA